MNRTNWVFPYGADKLLAAARSKHDHHGARLKWWEEKKLEVVESRQESKLIMRLPDDLSSPETWSDFVQRYPEKLGKAAPAFNRSPLEANIVITTASSLKMPSELGLSPKGLGEEWERRPLADRLEEAQRREAVSVALRQPHMPSVDDPRRSEPLGRFCATPHPSTGRPLGDHCWQAGQRYAEIVKDHKIAWGFDIPGGGPSDRGFTTLTQPQIEARKELATQRKKEADRELIRIDPRLPSALENLVYYCYEPSPYHEGILIHGLVNLAVLWGFKAQRFGT